MSRLRRVKHAQRAGNFGTLGYGTRRVGRSLQDSKTITTSWMGSRGRGCHRVQRTRPTSVSWYIDGQLRVREAFKRVAEADESDYVRVAALKYLRKLE